ncbi:MAG: ribosome small subunit-dependent GTPase A [Gemmatimonadota bacterium]|nr:ribosome small subunit-dependent GTPase A [Gemmatimonadota bacterium]
MTGRVLEAAGGAYRVRLEGRVVECSLRGRIKQGEGSIAVGDEVRVETAGPDAWCIAEVLPRRSRLARRSFAKRREQVLAANVDAVAAVIAVARPEPDLFLLDRLLVVAEVNGLASFIVCNKIDLTETAETMTTAKAAEDDAHDGGAHDGGARGEGDPSGSELPPSLRPYEEAGYAILPTSVSTGRGMAALADRLRGRTTVLAGASGVGKSSLVNALAPGTGLRTGGVGDRSGRGRHTTTAGRLIPLGDDTYLADTPGVQNFEPAALEPAELAAAFPEFRPHLGECRFADCRHREEPGCAIREAVEEGRIAPRRHESFLALLEAAERAARPWERRER